MPNSLRFGTDGVRGRAHTELTTEWVARLARAAAQVLGGSEVVIGSDGRESGPAFVAALASGFALEGMSASSMGVVPTPSVAHIANAHGIIGAMVSASHNPYHDNGIKFFAPGGSKLSDENQHRIESLVAEMGEVAISSQSAVLERDGALVDEWLAAIAASIDGRSLDGLSIVIDCANGASSEVAPGILTSLGAAVTTINARPDGSNINRDCGSTHPASLKAAVLVARADVGLAFDGDADRVLAVDAAGNLVDGDQIIGICAVDLQRRGMLADETVVVTVMTNLGFHLGMAERSITVHETPVGDRNVLEAIGANGWSLGGEQSGHVIFGDIATTGDGLLTGIQLLDTMARRGLGVGPLADEAMHRLPQVLENIEVTGDASALVPAIAHDIDLIERRLGSTGRVLVRPSGTEPLLRIMAEAATAEEARAAVDDLIAATKRVLAR